MAKPTRDQNADGSFKTDASHKSLAAFYGEDAIKLLSDLTDVHPRRLNWYLDLIKQQATIAAHYGRISLKAFRWKEI
jgi:hypothetical protein